jgi:uroporphyrinogen III methyltransferase/synthase
MEDNFDRNENINHSSFIPHNSSLIGKVYLVGAGPGSIDYLTIRAQQLLDRAEVLVYDALVDPQILELVPANCLKLYVGKRGGSESFPQEKIDRLLVYYCLQGKQVVRLKSGDPFIFGRSREEIEVLIGAGCNFELVPGISSAIAAPLLAGIPLTDKDLSSCFAVASAHQPDILDWEALARIDTLVILMGGGTLPKIVANLIANGRSPSYPVAIVKNCGRIEQEIWQGTLSDIVDLTAGISLSPSVIIIGKVVELADNFSNSSQNLPLAGKTVLVTRAAEQSSQFTNLLQAKGAKVIEMPALEIMPPSSWDKLDRAIDNLADFDWLILTSANGVEYFFDRLAHFARDTRALAGIKIAVVGKKTASVLKQKGIVADFIPPDFVADSLVENFPEPLQGQKILFPRVETGGREVLVTELTASGAEVIEVPAYQSGCPQQINSEAWQAIETGQVDIVTFASSKTVKNFCQLVENELKDRQDRNIRSILEKICLASIGPQTSQTCGEAFGRVDVEAKEYTLPGLTEAIVNKFRA